MDNTFECECDLKKQNKYLEERLNCTQESLRRVYQREALYQSTLQNLKNDLTKFCKRIDTAPHSSYLPYREAYYGENKYKNALEEIEEYINQYEMLGKLNIKYILNIINKAKGGA